MRHKQLLKDYEKQEKKLQELKNKGRSCIMMVMMMLMMMVMMIQV